MVWKTSRGTVLGTKRLRLSPRLPHTVVTALLGASTLPAQAGSAVGTGSITFSPADVAAVPTLAGSLLVLLAGLLALIAVKAYRRADRGIAPMVAGVLAVGSLISAGGGVEIIRQAQGGVADTPVTNANGQTFELDPGPNVFLNDAGILLEVTELSAGECSILPNESPLPECTIGTTVTDGERCQVNIASCPR